MRFNISSSGRMYNSQANIAPIAAFISRYPPPSIAQDDLFMFSRRSIMNIMSAKKHNDNIIMPMSTAGSPDLIPLVMHMYTSAIRFSIIMNLKNP